MQIRTVTVIGANGTMGRNVAAIFASFGNAKVYMVSRDIEKAKIAAEKAVKSVKADSIRRNLYPVDFSSLEECVKESDLVFESVAEDMVVKSDVLGRIRSALKAEAICCSGTSGLSITKLAELLPPDKRGNYFGVHMYNPPYNMVLCELIPSAYANKNIQVALKQYLSGVLRRTVVEVKDSPAFLGNRIGFQFINEAMQQAQHFRDSGGIDYIDSILGPFTGRSMAPLVTSDFVGLDIHKAIVDNLYNKLKTHYRDTLIMPDYAVELVKEGKLGRKTEGGLYKTLILGNNEKKYLTYDISAKTYRERYRYNFSFAEKTVAALCKGEYKTAAINLVSNESVEAEICVEFLLKYIVNALHASLDVGDSTHDADDVMANGFNWCPPQAMLEWLSSTGSLYSLIQERLPWDFKNSVDIEKVLQSARKSKYDYRRFLLAKR